MTNGPGDEGEHASPAARAADDPETSHDVFRVLGRQVKILRERGGLSQRELGDRLGYSEASVSSMEQGRRTPQPEFLEAVDRLLDAGGLLASARGDVEQAKARARVRHPAWFRDYAVMERDAIELHYFSTLTVPGLLQTEDYARTMFALRQPVVSEDVIEQRVSARTERQRVLTRPSPPLVTAVIDESVLLRPVGGEQVRRGQLRRLLQLGSLRNMLVHVLPLSCEDHAALEGPFVLLTPKGRTQVGYLEVQSENRLLTDPETVRVLAARYGCLRGQALSPRASMAMIERMLGEH